MPGPAISSSAGVINAEQAGLTEVAQVQDDPTDRLFPKLNPVPLSPQAVAARRRRRSSR